MEFVQSFPFTTMSGLWKSALADASSLVMVLVVPQNASRFPSYAYAGSDAARNALYLLCGAKGYRAQKIKDILEKNRENMVIYVGLSTLTYLKKGGRISSVAAVAADVLKIKPVMKFGVGKLDVYQKCRGMKNARKAMIDAMKKEFETNFKEAYEAGKLYLMAASSSTAEVTEEWIRQIKESFPGMDVMCDNLSLGLSCHIGPDGLGIACCNKAE